VHHQRAGRVQGHLEHPQAHARPAHAGQDRGARPRRAAGGSRPAGSAERSLLFCTREWPRSAPVDQTSARPCQSRDGGERRAEAPGRAHAQVLSKDYQKTLLDWVEPGSLPDYLGGTSRATLLDDAGPWQDAGIVADIEAARARGRGAKHIREEPEGEAAAPGAPGGACARAEREREARGGGAAARPSSCPATAPLVGCTVRDFFAMGRPACSRPCDSYVGSSASCRDEVARRRRHRSGGGVRQPGWRRPAAAGHLAAQQLGQPAGCATRRRRAPAHRPRNCKQARPLAVFAQPRPGIGLG
jgi:hypothetical protein